MTSIPRLYVDTSAYLNVFLREPDHERIAAELTGAQLLSSALLPLEASRTLIHLTRTGRLSMDLGHALDELDTDLAVFTFRELTIDLCRGRAFPLASTPRSLDLAHLRTALWFHEERPLTRFVSLDREQNLAARELGLPV